MKIHCRSLGIVLGLAALAPAATCRATDYNQFQPAQSAITFQFKQMNVPVDGRFRKFQGQMSFDPAKPAQAKAEIDIAIAGIDAGSDEANDEVAGKLWFDTGHFPTARFVATSIKPLGDNRYDVVGQMTIKGKSQPAIVPATLRLENSTAVLQGSFFIKRGDFGIGQGMWADYATVANEVRVQFRLVVSASGKK